MRARLGALLAAAVLPAALVTAATAGPAQADVRYGPIPNPASVHPMDSNWGGYIATGSNFRSISGSWTEPQVQCGSYNDLFAPWLGIDGYGTQTVEQAGVETNCSSGSPQYRAWYEMYPAAPVYFSDPVSAGDTITCSVTTDGSGSYELTIGDSTKGWSEHTTQSLNGANASAEAVIESPTGSYPSFSQLHFSDITIDGQPLAGYNPVGLTSGGYTPTGLSGGSFSMVPGGGWLHPGHSAAHAGSGQVRY